MKDTDSGIKTNRKKIENLTHHLLTLNQWVGIHGQEEKRLTVVSFLGIQEPELCQEQKYI